MGIFFSLLMLSSVPTLDNAEAVVPQAEEAPKAEAAEKVDAVEKVETVEVAEAVEATEASVEEADELSPQILVGRLHPSVVHFPIAWLMLLVLCEIAALRWPEQKFLTTLSPWLLGLTIASFIPGIVSGLLRFEDVAQHDPEGQGPALLHRNLMLACTLVCSVAWALRFKLGSAPKGSGRWVYLGLILAAALLVSVGGHVGGELVYGDDYLPF